jgi:hypothetical protein
MIRYRYKSRKEEKGSRPKEYKMKLYATKQELYDTCMKSEAGITVIAVPVYSEDDGEFLGYEKEYVD